LISVALALCSAAAWGAADFAGGIGSRRIGIFRTVFFQEVIGLALLMPALAITGERLGSARVLIYGCLAGLCGNAGLLLLYHALATGNMSIAAPVSALMTAILPVAVGSFSEGFPGPLKLAGFGVALLAVWLISQQRDDGKHVLAHLSDLRLPLLAGVGFGLFFILIHEAARENTIWPMVASRATGLLLLGGTIAALRQGWAVPRSVQPVIIVNGVLDIGGNAFYILSGQLGRLDVAAVVSSLYPGATVLLAWILLKERLTRTQWVGIAAALTAILLLTA
jgi:drug/metabolite transporter (DMT)-like permease